MTIFVVMLPEGDQPRLVDKIRTEFPKDCLEVTPKQWLISASGTTGELGAKLGIFDANNPDAPVVGNGIVFAMASYTGRAPATIWEWIKDKWEAKVSG